MLVVFYSCKKKVIRFFLDIVKIVETWLEFEQMNSMSFGLWRD